MRVVSGIARGRKLKTPSGNEVRPTADSVKEAVFNILRNDVEGRRVLDLFAGSGQMGIEALSRGAKEAVFVDISRTSLKLVNENLALCGFQAETVKEDALSYLKKASPFDIIIIDPPYDSDYYEKVLELIKSFDILTDGGIIVVETRRNRVLPDIQQPYKKLKDYGYGTVKITLYTKEKLI